jgi:hypothetical protein
MNSKKLAPELQPRQDDVFIALADRRILLGASLRLLGHRFSRGQPICRDDVTRIAALADDASERAKWVPQIRQGDAHTCCGSCH